MYNPVISSDNLVTSPLSNIHTLCSPSPLILQHFRHPQKTRSLQACTPPGSRLLATTICSLDLPVLHLYKWNHNRGLLQLASLTQCNVFFITEVKFIFTEVTKLINVVAHICTSFLLMAAYIPSYGQIEFYYPFDGHLGCSSHAFISVDVTPALRLTSQTAPSPPVTKGHPLPCHQQPFYFPPTYCFF